MSGGGGGGSAPKTPESEIASKQIETQRYDMAAGINSALLPKYVQEAQRDLSNTAAGRANADIMSKTGNAYVGNLNPFAGANAQNAITNARNTAIIKARGAADTNRIERTDAALRSLNGTAEGAAQGLLASASRQSDVAWNAAINRYNTDASKTAAAVSLLGSLGGIAYDKYKRGEWFNNGKKVGQGYSSWDEAGYSR